jgi:hypothetical protein
MGFKSFLSVEFEPSLSGLSKLSDTKNILLVASENPLRSKWCKPDNRSYKYV